MFRRQAAGHFYCKLVFPKSLSQLDACLGMTGWLRNYVSKYAALSKPLQDRKTTLLSGSLKAGNERKNYSTRIQIKHPTDAEIASFEALQKALSTPSFLVNFDDSLTLYIDLNASKVFGFGAMVHHVIGDVKNGEYPSRPSCSSVSSVLFFNVYILIAI